MQYFERTFVISKIKDLSNQNKISICCVPEFVSIQVSANVILSRNISSELREKIQKLKKYQDQFGVGILPFKLAEAKKFIEDLYNDMLNNHLPLPANIIQSDLPLQITNLVDYSRNIYVYEHKIKFQRNNLTFFAKYLPLIGMIVTYTLTVGLTYSSLVTIFGWGWSLPLLCVFGLCKFLTSYADVAGGPERRLQTFGFWIDRKISQIYIHYGKFSASQLFLNFLVLAILTCSTLLTWYSAWQMIRCIAWIKDLPYILSSSLAGIFAWSSAGATFGRIYSDLNQLLFRNLHPYFNFDDIKESEKVNLNALPEKLKLIKSKTLSINEIPIHQPSILMQYYQQFLNSPNTNYNLTGNLKYRDRSKINRLSI